MWGSWGLRRVFCVLFFLRGSHRLVLHCRGEVDMSMFLKSTVAAATIATIPFLFSVPAQADECLIDIDDDFAADEVLAVDQDSNENLVCGRSSTATTGAIDAVAYGHLTDAGTNATAIGDTAQATGAGSTALGSDTEALGKGSIAIGADSDPADQFSDANGKGAQATAEYALALGVDTSASGARATAIAIGASASGTESTVIGFLASATGAEGLALGRRTEATVFRATAIGSSAKATGVNSMSIGRGSIASATNATAIGEVAQATNIAATAIGSNARSSGEGSTAVGRSAVSSRSLGTAVGYQANVKHFGATAIGANATTTNSYEVAIGGTGSSVRIGDIDNSTLMQVGPVDVVTVDANGTLGRGAAASAAAVDRMSLAFGQTMLAHEADIDALFDLTDQLQGGIEQANEGVAMALAMESPAVPAGASFALSGGVGNYNGRTSLALAISTAVGEKASVSAGVGVGANSGEVGTRAGFQIAW